MDNAWKLFKKVILILILIYFLAFIFYTDFLIKLTEIKPLFDFSRYLYKILNLQ